MVDGGSHRAPKRPTGKEGTRHRHSHRNPPCNQFILSFNFQAGGTRWKPLEVRLFPLNTIVGMQLQAPVPRDRHDGGTCFYLGAHAGERASKFWSIVSQ